VNVITSGRNAYINNARLSRNRVCTLINFVVAEYKNEDIKIPIIKLIIPTTNETKKLLKIISLILRALFIIHRLRDTLRLATNKSADTKFL
jgi:hypothetical protein